MLLAWFYTRFIENRSLIIVLYWEKHLYSQIQIDKCYQNKENNQ
jgi:hypothetical protein